MTLSIIGKIVTLQFYDVQNNDVQDNDVWHCHWAEMSHYCFVVMLNVIMLSVVAPLPTLWLEALTVLSGARCKEGAMTFDMTTFSILTISIATISIMSLNVTTIIIMTLGVTAISIMTIGKMLLGITKISLAYQQSSKWRVAKHNHHSKIKCYSEHNDVMTQGTMTVGIMIVSITTVSIMRLIITIKMPYWALRSFESNITECFILIVTFYCYAEWRSIINL